MQAGKPPGKETHAPEPLGTHVVLTTERLSLRKMVSEDAGFMLALLNSRGFIEGIGDRGVRTPDEAADYIRDRVLQSYSYHGFGMWAVVRRSDGNTIGIAGLVKRDTLEHVDLGYALLEEAWGCGFAQEAAAGVLEHARSDLGMDIVLAIAAPTNISSHRVLKKIGMVYDGLRELPGSEGPCAVFASYPAGAVLGLSGETQTVRADTLSR